MKVLRIIYDILAIIVILICPTFIGEQIILLHKKLFADMGGTE